MFHCVRLRLSSSSRGIRRSVEAFRYFHNRGSENHMKNTNTFFLASLLTAVALSACSPRVSVEVPKEPITINLNVKIDHEVRVKVEKDLDKVLNEKSELF